MEYNGDVCFCMEDFDLLHLFLLFIILGSLMKAGFEMQREMDEIL